MPKLIYTSFLILFFFTMSLVSYPQIVSTQSKKDIITENDFQIFIYDKIENISLIYEQGDNATFEWVKFDEATKSWNNVVQTQIGKATTFLINEPGGYALKVSDGLSEPITYNCWAFEPKISNLSIDIDYEDCFQLSLEANYEKTPLLYYNNLGQQLELDYDLTYNWSSEPSADSFENSKKIMLDAPYEESEYKIQIIPFSISSSSTEASLKYNAIAVKAIYKAEELKADVTHELHTEMGEGRTILEGSAPIEMRFTDESKGSITAREWKFTGSKVSKGGTQPFHVFTAIAEKDSVLLTVRNEMSGCEDIVDNPVIVNAFESLIEAPNTFTPNGDGINDEFRVVYRSIKKYNIVIFNRWGRKVYESTDPAQGWDGRIGRTLAAPGVYFYTIEAEGFNKDEKHKLQGNIHLIRGR